MLSFIALQGDGCSIVLYRTLPSLQHCSLLHVPIHSRPISIEFSFDLATGCKCPLPFEKLAYHVWILLSALIFEEWEKKRQGNQLDSSIVQYRQWIYAFLIMRSYVDPMVTPFTLCLCHHIQTKNLPSILTWGEEAEGIP